MESTADRKEEEERHRAPCVVAIDDTGAMTILIENVNNATGIQVFWSAAVQKPSDEEDLDDSDVIPLSDFKDGICSDDVSIPFADDAMDEDASVVQDKERVMTVRSPKMKRTCVMTGCRNDVYTECAVYNPLLCYEHLIASARGGVYGMQQPDRPAGAARPVSPWFTYSGQVKPRNHLIEWCKENRLVSSLRASVY